MPSPYNGSIILLGNNPMMLDWLRRLFSPSAAAPTIRAAASAATSAPVHVVPAPPAAAPPPPPPVVPCAQAQAGAVTPALPPDASASIPFDDLAHTDAAWTARLFARADTTDDGLDMNDQENRVFNTLHAILSAHQSGAALVRRMPGLVPQLLQSLRSDNFSGSALSRTISSDVVLVEAVIRLANSAGGNGGAIASVEHAVILIGQEGLRQLITTVAFRPIIDLHAGHYVRLLAPRLWEQAERCAVEARRRAGAGIEPFDAFLAALLLNVGPIVALRVMDQVTGGAPALGSALFVAQLGGLTARIGAGIGREWHFPNAVVRALEEQGGVGKGMRMSPLGHLLQSVYHDDKVRLLAEQEMPPAGAA
jgi:predicted outer membrane repeat protein